MFAITRHDPLGARTMRDLMSFVTRDPFVALSREAADDATPAVDISEADGHIIVRASLPGFKADEVDVQLHEGVLTIKAEHAEEHETGDEQFYCRERSYGAVSRRLALPGIVTDENATAELENGVLTLRIPQTDDKRPKHITVN